MSATESVELPPYYWGLHPMYWEFVRLVARQIVNLQNFAGLLDSHRLGEHPLSRAQIVGTVVSRLDRGNFVKYTVDDGTGVVDCVVFTQSQDGTAKVGVPSFRLGDTVSVRGRLRLPRDLYAVGKPLRELIVVTARRCRDDNEQFVHWADVMLLSRTFYSKPLRELLPDIPGFFCPEGEAEESPCAASGAGGAAGETMLKPADASSERLSSTFSAHPARTPSQLVGDGDAEFQASPQDSRRGFFAAVMDVLLRSHPHSETRRINSACARGDVDVGATTAISSSPTWTFALPEFFTADDVAACQWLRDLCFQALVRDDPGSGAFAQREVDEVCKTWTAAALVGMMKHGMVYVEERAEEATRFGLVSHSELVGPVMRKAIVEICSQNSGAKPASKRSRVETTKAEHSAPLLGAAASQIMEAVRRDVRLRYLPYAAMRRSIQLLCSSGDIFETAPDTYQLDE